MIKRSIGSGVIIRPLHSNLIDWNDLSNNNEIYAITNEHVVMATMDLENDIPCGKTNHPCYKLVAVCIFWNSFSAMDVAGRFVEQNIKIYGIKETNQNIFPNLEYDSDYVFLNKYKDIFTVKNLRFCASVFVFILCVCTFVDTLREKLTKIKY